MRGIWVQICPTWLNLSKLQTFCLNLYNFFPEVNGKWWAPPKEDSSYVSPRHLSEDGLHPEGVHLCSLTAEGTPDYMTRELISRWLTFRRFKESSSVIWTPWNTHTVPCSLPLSSPPISTQHNSGELKLCLCQICSHICSVVESSSFCCMWDCCPWH